MADATLKMVLLGQDRGASKAIKGVGDAAQTTERRSSKLGDAFKKAGKLAAVGLAAGAVAGAVGLFKMTKMAIEDEGAQKRLATTLKNTTGANKNQVKSVEDWITAQGKALGVTDDELRPALDRLVRSTHDVGGAQKLASLAMDASAGTGKSLQTVSEALGKAHDGNVGGLARLGIATKDASGKTLTFDQITKNMSQTFKGQAKAGAETLEGKMKRLHTALSEAGETIGGKLIPIVTKMADWFVDKAMPAISNFFDGMQSGKGIAGAFGKILEGVGKVIKAVAGWIGRELVPFLKDLVGRFRDSMGGSKGFKDSLNNMKPAVRVVIAVLKVLWEGIKWAAKILIPIIVAGFKVWTRYIGLLGKAATWLWNNAFQPALKMIVKGFGWVVTGIGKMLSALGNIPGFGWAKKAGDKMQAAGEKARKMADAIKDIPEHKVIHVKYKVTVEGRSAAAHGGSTYPGAGVNQAVGSRHYAGGTALVGERGPELVNLPRGSGVMTAQQSARAMTHGGSGDLGTLHVVVSSDTGVVLEKKLARLKRRRGGKLEFEFA